jgi:hypothetical protein
METIASLCIKHNFICISDEHITYERNQTKIGKTTGTASNNWKCW